MDADWSDKVRARAYAIREREGRPEGGAAERHWAQVEAEPRAEGDGTLNPGDDAPPGTPGTGEDVCPACHGTGRVEGGPCPDCGGTGKVIAGVGGA